MSTFSRKNKGQILFSLSMFVMFFIGLASTSFQQLDTSESFRLADEMVERLHVQTLYLLKLDVDLHNYELSNPAFYDEESTPRLQERDSLFASIDSLMSSIRAHEDFELARELSLVDSLIETYQSRFLVLTDALRRKGFKDFGMEGQLRKFAHALEERRLVSEDELLTLRRHEKDFLLRDDRQYVERFNSVGTALIGKYGKSEETEALLLDYMNAFNELVKLSNSIGFHVQTGLKGELNAVTSSLLSALDDLNAKGELQTVQNQRSTFKTFVLAVAFTIVFSGILIYVTARSL